MKSLLKFLGTPFFLAGMIYKAAALAFGYGQETAQTLIVTIFLGPEKMAEIARIEQMVREIALSRRAKAVAAGAGINTTEKAADPKDAN